jgi:leucyl-tRNA synthetase
MPALEVDTESSMGIGEDEPAEYEAATVEQRWQAAWQEAGLHLAPVSPDTDTRCAYVFAQHPRPAAHTPFDLIRSYTIADAHARFLRARGIGVLFSLGFDSFGLDVEREAISRQVTSAAWAEQCVTWRSEQFRRLGISLDFSRVSSSSEPEMYQYTQRLFLMLLEQDLVFRENREVEWCAHCETTLADYEIRDGQCGYCSGPMSLVQRWQWYLRLGAYLRENEERLVGLDGWNEPALESQRAFPGGVDGVEFDVTSLDGAALTVFTPHEKAIKQAAFIAISPKHPDIAQWISAAEMQSQMDQALAAAAGSDQTTIGIETGRLISGVGTETPLPVIVSSAVEAQYGPTAVLGIPTMDMNDAHLAQQLKPAGTGGWQIKGSQATISPRPARRYQDRIVLISHPRSWGTPIPVVHCKKCGLVPVRAKRLPVKLPPQLQVQVPGGGNPLELVKKFVIDSCPRCSMLSRRETDTLDPHFDGLWRWMAACVPPDAPPKTLFSDPALKRWLPAEQMIRGVDEDGSMFDQRLAAKILRDQGTLQQLTDGEPFTGVTAHQPVDLQNVPDFDGLMERMGADVLRLTILYSAAPGNVLTWNGSTLFYCRRWLTSFWDYAQPRLFRYGELDELGEVDEEQRAVALRTRLEKWCRIAVERVTENYEHLAMHRAARNIMALLIRIEDFEKRTIARHSELTTANRRALSDALLIAVQLIAPLTPHLAEELWAISGREGFVATAPWPDLQRTSA